uniref:Wsv301 n=1 Tax=White spot syndrome virus TaxID=92652 RepID=A0A2U9GE84_WSSV|nr:wsv301 [Shrimp white spot syndrome virus]
MGSEMSRSLSGVLNRTWLMKLDSVLLPFLFFLFLFFSHGEQEMQVVVLSMHFTSMFMASASPIVMEQPTANPLRKVTRIMLSVGDKIVHLERCFFLDYQTRYDALGPCFVLLYRHLVRKNDSVVHSICPFWSWDWGSDTLPSLQI